jgi:sn-glycerol 3-phosphate transport system substrate-binding protein
MKRLRALTLGVAFVLGLAANLYAGGSTETAASTNARPVELNLFFPVAVGGPVTTIVDTICQNFNKENPGIKVTAVYTGSYADTMIKAQTGIKSGTPPDMAVIQATELFTLLDMDAIEPLDAYVAKDSDKTFIDDFHAAFLENSQAVGKLWSLPFQRSTIVLYYNKEMFKRAGLDPAKAPKSWNELVEYAQKLTIRKPDGNVETWGLEIPSTGFQYWMFQALALQNGRQIMDQNGTNVYFDNQEAIEAMQFWIDLTKKYTVMPEGVIEWATVPTDFMQGRTAMMFHTTGNLTNVRKGSTFDFGVAYLPAGKRFGSPTGGGNLYMFKGISQEKKDAAWKFMRFATSPAQAAYFSMSTGYVATRKSAFETDLLKGYVTGFPQALVARDQLEFAKAELSTHANSQIYKIVNDAIQSAMVGTRNASEAMKAAQMESDKILEAFRK